MGRTGRRVERMDERRLRSIPLFASLSDRDRRQVAYWTDEIDIGEGERLVNQGAFAHEFFAILEGEAEVTREDQHLADLGPGDFFGEIALETDDRRTATVTAKSPMKLVVMFGRDFRQMETSMPQVAAQIKDAIEERRKR
jgi:CRP/FNR family transcriptional regulator, cyclic AMP receptor protein